MSGFDPNQPGDPDKIFGFPYTAEEAEVVLLPIPWEVTASYGEGTASGPAAIQEASLQLDFEISGVAQPWQLPIALVDPPPTWLEESNRLRKKARAYIQWIEEGKNDPSDYFEEIRQDINRSSEKLRQEVKETSAHHLNQGKVVGTIGGDHSTPLGLIDQLANLHNDFGILQIDAHMDLRDQYEGFTHSHASIMKNALRNPEISRLTQVGIRDYCAEEKELVNHSNERIIPFYDPLIKERQMKGESIHAIFEEIIATLPRKVYISFDIDGLDPKLCPNTGTPVPGGLDFHQAIYLIKMLVVSGKEVIGFDLSEVSPGVNAWDANVGARILYHLCAYTGISNGKLKFDK